MAKAEHNPPSSPFWAPHVHVDRRPFLLARNAIINGWRRWFAEQGFIEVETATLQISPGADTHTRAFATQLTGPDGSPANRFLHASPELACKKLIAAGEKKIFTFARVFRNGEQGPLHQPEFTLLEWYRAGEPYEQLVTDCLALAGIAAAATENPLWRWREHQCDPSLPIRKITVADAFQQYAGVNLEQTLGPENRDSLAAQAADIGIRITGSDDWSDIFSKVISDRIEPHLGIDALTVLDKYPASQAALARIDDRNPRYAQRFELYACGVELANAFGELTDREEQERRFKDEERERQRRYGVAYPLDQDFLDALDYMPAASGIALGVDRLIMLACGAPSIDKVMWTPPQK